MRIAGLGGVWQAVVLGFAGLDLMGDALGLDPKLPPAMEEPVVPRALAGRIVPVGIAGGVVQATLAAGEAWSCASPAARTRWRPARPWR